MDSCKKAFLFVACSGLFILGIEGLVLPASAQEAGSAEQRESLTAKPLLTADAARPASELPDSPGATLANLAEGKQQDAPQKPPVNAPSSSAEPAQSGARTQSTPVGTAVAESPNASGIAASQPAGVAIAPAKQRRVRTIVLRMGAIVGAGVAVGSVVALTAGTSSKPPGAH